MLQFFCKYQSRLFAIAIFVISISFSFFLKSMHRFNQGICRLKMHPTISQKLLFCRASRFFTALTVTALLLSMSAQALADDKIEFTETLDQTLSDTAVGLPTIKTKGIFKVKGRWTPPGFTSGEINKATVVAFNIGRWNFNQTMGEATVFDEKQQKAEFSFNSHKNSSHKEPWLKIVLKWNQQTISFNVEGRTTEFVPSPLAGDFLTDEVGPIVASTTGSFRVGGHYSSFGLPLKGNVYAKEKTARKGAIYSLKRDQITAEGAWATWANDSLSLSSTAMSGKGLCIEDRSAALPPSANYPIIATDTFPSVWPQTTFPIENIRVFSYSLGSAPAKQWVLWAIQHNIKVLVGINLQDYATDLANLSADYLAADAYLRSCFDSNILAYAIGNEANIPEIPSIIDGIHATQALIAAGKLPAKPVSTVLNLNEQWIVNAFPPQNAEFTTIFKTLLAHLDIMMFNTYGGYFIYEPSLLQASLSWTSNGEIFSVLLNQFGSIRSAALKAGALSKPLWICETGWSSAPLSNHPEPTGWSSSDNLKTFYMNFLSFDQKTPFFPQLATQQVQPPDMIFFFGLRDSYLPLLDVEEYFGLYKSSPTLIEKDL